MNNIPSVVLAGGRASPELAARIGSQVRALAPFNGTRLIDLVVGALQQSDLNGVVTVVGDVGEMLSVEHVADQGDFVSNIIAGVSGLRDADWALITSADLPFLTGPVIGGFVQEALTRAKATDAEIIYPVVSVDTCYLKYPGIKRTAIRLNEGRFTGGNMILARPRFFLQRRKVLTQAFAARKSPLRLAQMLGFGTVVRLVASQLLLPRLLDIAQLEMSVGRLMQGKVAALISDSPELATDLDRASDFAHASAIAGTGTAAK